ncbi:potassium-transporting ATPase subunit KdpA [Legionella brunensis]|uniref:Potassium-transporting ATPase potassium-binding subunit n=1 Tax=Legionella brunensis TaxID=29422 RepID=A0A0W0SSX0_9GAMM|nr:potassium-transporting ATPase subunit KdpA [Legionella brunensis]KTC86348.1 potassium translocating ATPase, subunit A [Legionella brunensis]
MAFQSLLLLIVFLIVLFLFAYPLGLYMVKVAEGKIIYGFGWLIRFEKWFYRLAATSQDVVMSWKTYAMSLLIFNVIGVFAVYGFQRLQNWLPLNPQNFPSINPDLAFNTAISFVTNTNWQSYSGEETMSYLTQMVALTGQNFFSAATGMAVLFALIRGFRSHSMETIGNFWVDLTRSILYVLIPLSTVLAIALMSQGVIQNFSPYKQAQLIDPIHYTQMKQAIEGNLVAESYNIESQTLAMGPVASQEAIKLLGTNGGGFFNTNSAHPYENPAPLSNFLQMLAIFIIPVGLCFTFGVMVGDRRQSWAILGAMLLIFVVLVMSIFHAEQQEDPGLTALGLDQSYTPLQSGGNMEGKETRFGISASTLFASLTTSASCGAVNSMHDSYYPIGGMIPLVFMQLGEVIFGGVGAGLYSMLIFAILAVFISGLMIGRTPEYLGKKIQAYEMKMASITVLITPILVLVGTAIAVSFQAGKVGVANPGPHGFSEILYAFTSAGNNNGSAFAGLLTNTPFYNTLLAIVIWFGRFGMIVPVLAIAGSLARKKRISINVGTMPTHGPLFILLLIGTVILLGILNYIPALALAPIIEQLQFLTR